MIRTYEISGAGDYIFVFNETKIINNGKSVKVSFVDLRYASLLESTNVNCDGDETEILSFGISDKGSKLTINVQCSSNTTQNHVSCKFSDFYKGSINPTIDYQPVNEQRGHIRTCGTQPDYEPAPYVPMPIMSSMPKGRCGTCDRY